MSRQSNDTAQPLMPKATAVWLIENTGLTFRQIGAFCNLHELEVQSIADDEVAVGMVGYDPIANGQLTREEIARCEADPAERLKMAKTTVPRPATRTKGPRYTPVARRGDKPDAIAWLVKHFPNLADGQISRLIGTTKPTIKAIRDRSHWNMANISARDPVGLGLCNRQDLDKEVKRAGYSTTVESPPADNPPPANTPMPEFKL
ncbi:MAG: cell cycle transcriptional regulator TrcR [Alphaproteobacteria bacterium]